MHAVGADGKRRWTFKTAGPIEAAACVLDNGRVIFGCYDGLLRALHPDGTLDWSVDLVGNLHLRHRSPLPPWFLQLPGHRGH